MEDIKKLKEIKIILDELHKDWSKNDDDHHCKSSEGAISITYHYNNWFEAGDYINDKPYGITVSIYSYLFGESRMHDFDSFDEALSKVKDWQIEWYKYRLRESND